MRLPSVEMLWADDDAATVLRERFHHGDAASVVLWLSSVLEREYELTLTACTRIVMSDQNALAWVETPGGAFVVKWCVAASRFERLASLAEMTLWLAERGHPVSVPLRSAKGLPQVVVDGAAVTVQREIAAELLDVTDLEAVRSVGVELARLHHALWHFPAAEEVAGEAPGTWAEGVVAWATALPAQVPSAVRSAVIRALEASGEEPPSQLLHGDVRAANLLCRDHRLVAFLDFEESRHGPAVDELARAAVMLGTRFRAWAPVPPEVHEALREGYENIRPLTAAEGAWWRALILLYSAAFIPEGADPQGWGVAARHLVDSGA